MILTNPEGELQNFLYHGNIIQLMEYQAELDLSNCSLLGFTIGKSSLQDVQNKVGIAGIVRESDHEGSDYQLYYCSSVKGDNTIVIFNSGPLGGWEYLNGFTLTTREYLDKKNVNCKTSSLVNEDVATPSGLKLGLSKEQVENILGMKPSKIEGSSFLYLYHAKNKMPEEDFSWFRKNNPSLSKEDAYYDVVSFVEAKFKKNKLISISVYKTESF